MPNSVPGLFSGFDNLDQIKAEDVMRALKPMPAQIWLENYIANRILYPQAVAISAYDMQIDLAILTMALKLNKPAKTVKKNEFLGDNPFINTTLRKIIIPTGFLDFVCDLPNLTAAFINGLLLERSRKDLFEDLWTVSLSGEREEIIGSILMPQFNFPGGFLELKLNNKIFKIKAGYINCLPCPEERCLISFNIDGGNMLGKTKGVLEVYGSKLGIVVDGRLKSYDNQ